MNESLIRDLKKWGIRSIRYGTLQYLHSWYMYYHDETWVKKPEKLIEELSDRYIEWLEDFCSKQRL